MSGVEDVPILRMGYFKIVEKEPNIASGFKGTTNNHAHAFTIYGRKMICKTKKIQNFLQPWNWEESRASMKL